MERPSAISVKTACSRSVSSCSGSRARWRVTSARTRSGSSTSSPRVTRCSASTSWPSSTASGGFWSPSRISDSGSVGGLWDYLGSHPDNAARFSRAMGYVTSRPLAALTAAGYRPPPGQRIVDVGGSRGRCWPGSSRRYPRLPGWCLTEPNRWRRLRATWPPLGSRILEEHRKLIEPAGYALTGEVPLGATTTAQQSPWQVLEFRRD